MHVTTSDEFADVVLLLKVNNASRKIRHFITARKPMYNGPCKPEAEPPVWHAPLLQLPIVVLSGSAIYYAILYTELMTAV